MRFNRKAFFDGVKDRIDPTLNQEQVNGFDFLLGRFENDPQWADVRHVAYGLATVWHETAYSMQPVEEGYYLGSERRVKAFQKTLRYFPYFGRGYVQLTWKTNYEKAGKAFGVDLVNEPELALTPEIAFKCLGGMFKGWYGAKLTTHINAQKTDYVNARRCVNVLDKAGLIAGYAKSFERILKDSAANGSTPAPVFTAPSGALNGAPAPQPDDSQAGDPAPPTPPQAEGQTIVDVPPVATAEPESLVSKAKGWYVALPAGLTAFFSGVWSWIQGASAEITYGFFGASAAIGVTWIISNQWGKQKDKDRESAAAEKQKDRDFELTKLQLLSAMDPNKQTVRVKPPVIEIPAPNVEEAV